MRHRWASSPTTAIGLRRSNFSLILSAGFFQLDSFSFSALDSRSTFNSRSRAISLQYFPLGARPAWMVGFESFSFPRSKGESFLFSCCQDQDIGEKFYRWVMYTSPGSLVSYPTPLSHPHFVVLGAQSQYVVFLPVESGSGSGSGNRLWCAKAGITSVRASSRLGARFAHTASPARAVRSGLSQSLRPPLDEESNTVSPPTWEISAAMAKMKREKELLSTLVYDGGLGRGCDIDLLRLLIPWRRRDSVVVGSGCITCGSLSVWRTKSGAGGRVLVRGNGYTHPGGQIKCIPKEIDPRGVSLSCTGLISSLGSGWRSRFFSYILLPVQPWSIRRPHWS